MDWIRCVLFANLEVGPIRSYQGMQIFDLYVHIAMATMLFALRYDAELKSSGSTRFEVNHFGLESHLRSWSVENVDGTRVHSDGDSG